MINGENEDKEVVVGAAWMDYAAIRYYGTIGIADGVVGARKFC